MALGEQVLERLLGAAREARDSAYAPYSRYRVGAALLTRSGQIFSGCNVENASYGATICAERVAVGSAVVAGERDWVAVAVVADGATPPLPCGICRQVLSEFGYDLLVVCESAKGARHVAHLSELLPAAFTGEELKRELT
jgi:cytidine deaminase